MIAGDSAAQGRSLRARRVDCIRNDPENGEKAAKEGYLFLGIDLGTGSAKALLLSREGRTLGEGSAAYTVFSPRPGWAESYPKDWWAAVGRAGRATSGPHAGRVEAIGISGQMHGVVLCDGSGRPLRPAIPWADSRSAPQLEAYRRLDPALLRPLANPICVGMAGPSLLWLRDNERDAYSEARWALQPKDWLRLMLSGEAGSEPSDASGTLLYDVGERAWARPVLRALGLREDLLPALLRSPEVAGHLTAQAAEHLGLRPGLPIAAGAADTAAAILGTGLVKPGAVQLTVGTGAQIVAIRDKPVADPHLRTHLYCAATPDLWYSMAATQNAGLALRRVTKLLGVSWRDLYKKAFSVPAGSGGVTFLPYLSGERTPHFDPEIRGSWAGVGLSHKQGHLLRATLEGIAFSLRDGLEALEATGIHAGELRLAGGGSRDPRWRQMIADVLGKPLLAVANPAASARGAALLAGVASGAFPSLDEIPALETESPATRHSLLPGGRPAFNVASSSGTPVHKPANLILREPPQPPSSVPRFPLSLLQAPGILDAWRERCHLAVPFPKERLVEHLSARQPNIGQHPPAAVSLYNVRLQGHLLALEDHPGEPVGSLAVRPDAWAQISPPRSVHPDEPDIRQAVHRAPDLYGVPLHHPVNGHHVAV